jgi:hypothetical protein
MAMSDIGSRPPSARPEHAPEAAGVRAPRPWAAALSRPAARILVAGGVTLAGWLLGAALANGSASADELSACDTTAAHTPLIHDLGTRHHHHETQSAGCPQAPAPDPTTLPQVPVDEPAVEAPVESVQPQVTRQPAVKKQRTAAPHADLLGGLVGGLVDTVGGTLDTTLNTLSGVVGTVGTLGNTVLAPVVTPDAGGNSVLQPVDDLLDPVLGSASSASATVTAAVPIATTADVPAAAVTSPDAAPVPDQPQAARTIPARIPAVGLVLPAHQEKPRDSGTHLGGGGGSGPGLPSAPSAPAGPATSVTAGHDGPGGARQQAIVHTDDATTTQLRLIGTSRDHEVDGAGREAALPTTSPD